jgi:purine nucleosidase
MTRKIIIDTDPGQDDAVAILLALAAMEALEVLELAGRKDIPLHAGSPGPLCRRLVMAGHIHGATGLDGYAFPPPTMPVQAQPGVDFLIATLNREAPRAVTLCTLGPLTDIALALVRDPGIAFRIERIVMMAGAQFEVGNITPAADFNFYVDAEAADVVLRCGAPVTMLPLDITHRMRSTPARRGALRPRHPQRAGAGGDAGIFRRLRPGQMRLGRCAAARPLRARLHVAPGHLHRTRRPCRR